MEYHYSNIDIKDVHVMIYTIAQGIGAIVQNKSGKPKIPIPRYQNLTYIP